jgi:hypothetical protein
LPPRLIVTRWLWLLCSFQGPPRGRWAGRSARRPTGGHRSLKTQQHARPRARRDAARRTERRGRSRDARRRLGRPGPVDVLAARSVSGGGDRGDEGHDLPHGAVPYMPHTGLPRKEVIQPHLPVRLPCYDFTPVTSPTFDGSLPQGVRPPASGVAHSRGVTGGVYKARERIHRGSADPRLLATPPSCRRVSACNPNRDAL